MYMLPKELWLLIFEEVPPENAPSIARTCKAWRDLIPNMWSRWSKRYFPFHQKLPNYEPKLLIEGEMNWKKNKYTVKELYQHSGGVRCLKLTPERLYSSGNDDRIVVMNLATEEIELAIHTPEHCIALEVENERIFAGLNHSRLCVYDMCGSLLQEFQLSSRPSDHVYHVALTHKYLIANSADSFCVYDKNTLKLLHSTQHRHDTAIYGLSANDKFIAYGSDLCTKLLDHDSLEVITSITTKHQHNIQIVDDELLTNENSAILFWDIRNFSQKHRIQVNNKVSNPFRVRFVYDKKKLIVDWGSWHESQIQKVDPNSGEVLHTYQVEHGSSCFDMDPIRLVVGSNTLPNHYGISLLNFTSPKHK